jgi:gliding motility-associated-like protein
MPPVIFHMSPEKVYKTLLLASLLIIGGNVIAQRVFLTTNNDVYEMTGGIGSCTYKSLGHFCQAINSIESIAFHKDTLYTISASGDLYQINLQSPGSCKYLTNFSIPGFTAVFICLTCDKNGILYAVDANTCELLQYDPHTNSLNILGVLPDHPGGDLVFYKDTLLFASAFKSNIYAVNIAQPAASTVFMSIPKEYAVYGLFALPDNCAKTRLFATCVTFTTTGPPNPIVEMDPVARKFTNVICSVPFTANDAASSVEDGSSPGIFFDSLAVLASCGGNNNGKVQAFVSSAADRGTTYILDNFVTNTTGLFQNVSAGRHSIHIQTTPDCFADSSFILNTGLSNVIYQVTNPADCSNPDGTIAISASSQSLPILYSLNGVTTQTTPIFNNLTAGPYTLSITDAGHCEKDTGIILSFQHIPVFPGEITVDPTICIAKSGSIAISLSGNIPPSSISASLNDGPLQSSLNFPGLDAGSYTLHVNNTNGCRYDSLISIVKIIDAEPLIQADIQNQQCFTDNGSIHLSVSGANGPYLSSLDNGTYTPSLHYNDLMPSVYTVSIQDKNTCSWDTSFNVKAYPKVAVTLSVDSVNPVCTEMNSGSLSVSVLGDQAPYWLAFNNTTYASGSTIGSLSYGNYYVQVINQDGCAVDSAHVNLQLEVKPECNNIYLPNAFSPNGNGVNDLFRVIHAPYLTQFKLRVYDRYGELLFTSTEQQPGWDGNFHGTAQPPDTYVWTLNYTDLDNIGKTARGTVLLIR